MDIKQKRLVTGAQGSSASDCNSSWDERASSWQSGANTTFEAIEAEKKENDERYGIPYADNFPNPAANNTPDGPLENPHNFSSNPGFAAPMNPGGGGGMGSIGTSYRAPAPPVSLRPGQNFGAGRGEAGGGWTPGSTVDKSPNPVVGRSPNYGAKRGSVAMPDQQQSDPGAKSDVGPLVVTSGYGA